MNIEARLKFVGPRLTMTVDTSKLEDIWNPFKPSQLVY